MMMMSQHTKTSTFVTMLSIEMQISMIARVQIWGQKTEINELRKMIEQLNSSNQHILLYIDRIE